MYTALWGFSGRENGILIMSGKDGTPKALNNKDWRVRYAEANSPDASAEALRRLAKDEDRDVRRAVAGNWSAPAEALEKLARDEDRDVCRAVAVNPNTPEHVKVFLALISTR